MSSFPALRTGSVAQYPLARSIRFETQSVTFMDGSRQRFRLLGNVLRRWKIELNLLDETELAALTAFAEEQGSSIFSFADPVTGDLAMRCIISGQSYRAGMSGEFAANATLEIEEVA